MNRRDRDNASCVSDHDVDVDVVVVGASIAGCATAMHLGRAGLRVALVERQRSMDAFKALCGHLVLGGTRPALERLGLWDVLLARGAATSVPGIWTGTGWAHDSSDDAPRAISMRRKELDPLLRHFAASTPGVDLLMGHRVTGVLEQRGRVRGVEVTSDTRTQAITGRLVVGADGHTSPVATFAGVRTHHAPNGRFLYWGYYDGVTTRGPGEGQIWIDHTDVMVALPTDNGATLVGVFAAKTRLGEFANDRHAALERIIGTLPDAPDLSSAQRIGRVVGTRDYPFARRDPAPRPGLALVGDAAIASDPTPAVGCGWAFRSAEWLAAAVIPALTRGEDLDRALRHYRKAHRLVRSYDKLARRDARVLVPPAPARLIQRAAVHDAEIARRLTAFVMRAAPPSVVMNPRTLARASRVVRRQPAAASTRRPERAPEVRHA